MFWIRYTDELGNPTDVALSLNPTDVEYPDAEAGVIQTTQDGAVIRQKPARDGRPRKWIWRNFGPSDEPYATQWALLESLRGSTRARAGLAPTVAIWEDVSGVGGFARMDGATKVFTTVRVMQATRTPRPGGGPILYDSTVEFYIADDTYTSF